MVLAESIRKLFKLKPEDVDEKISQLLENAKSGNNVPGSGMGTVPTESGLSDSSSSSTSAPPLSGSSSGSGLVEISKDLRGTDVAVGSQIADIPQDPGIVNPFTNERVELPTSVNSSIGLSGFGDSSGSMMSFLNNPLGPGFGHELLNPNYPLSLNFDNNVNSSNANNPLGQGFSDELLNENNPLSLTFDNSVNSNANKVLWIDPPIQPNTRDIDWNGLGYLDVGLFSSAGDTNSVGAASPNAANTPINASLFSLAGNTNPVGAASPNAANMPVNAGLFSLAGNTNPVGAASSDAANTPVNAGLFSLAGITNPVGAASPNAANTPVNAGLFLLAGNTNPVSAASPDAANTPANAGLFSLAGITNPVSAASPNAANTPVNAGLFSLAGITNPVTAASPNAANTPVNAEVAPTVPADGNEEQEAATIPEKRSRKPTVARGEVVPLTSKDTSSGLPEWFTAAQNYLCNLEVESWKRCLEP